jgi:hypothetical protein
VPYQLLQQIPLAPQGGKPAWFIRYGYCHFCRKRTVARYAYNKYSAVNRAIYPWPSAMRAVQPVENGQAT